jgi:hypothetical protein
MATRVIASLDDVAVVGQAIEQRCRHLGITEDARPFTEVEVRGAAPPMRNDTYSRVAHSDPSEPRGPVDRAPPLPSIRSLKHYLRPEPGNESAPSNPAHISIVLNHRLDQEGSIKHQNVELNAVLGLPGRHAGGEELRAKTVSHIAQRHGHSWGSMRCLTSGWM